MKAATLMSQAHAAIGRDQEQAGAVILIATSALAAILVILGLVYAVGTSARSAAAIAAAGCEPGTGSEAAPCTTPAMLASQYTAILTPAARQIDLDTAAYAASEKTRLATAEAALTAEVITLQNFDTSLAGIAFPPAIAPIARALIRAEEARISLTAQQARSPSLTAMRSLDRRVLAASAAVQAEMNRLRTAIDTPVRAG
jgi:hypothetical protein